MSPKFEVSILFWHYSVCIEKNGRNSEMVFVCKFGIIKTVGIKINKIIV